MIFACNFINFITVPFFFAWKPKQLNDFMTYLGRYSHSYCLRCTSSAVSSFLHPILMKEICSTFLVFLNHFPCQFSKQRIKSIKKCRSSKIKNSQDISTFASQGFRSRSPFSSPWQIELDFVTSADRHLAVFTIPAYKNEINFTNGCFQLFHV